MCGIAGIFALSSAAPVQRREIQAQINTLLHRGPDQDGVYLSRRRVCGLGARRLSIIDVAGGRQPLLNEDNAIALVYNGETYNHAALRTVLEASGHRFRTHNDGETIVHGYEAWGTEEMLQKLRGMFTFALWDENRQSLILARDRFGVKPLYYTLYRGRLYFASEIKAILALSHIPRRVNLTALTALLRAGFTPGPATLFERIYKLPPAHYLTAANGTYKLKPYWCLEFHVDPRLTGTEAPEQFLALLEESVRLRLMSEVPLGALLSGGLDSGMLVGLMTRQMTGTLKTVSIGFEHPAYDETPLARQLARAMGTEHHAVEFRAADFVDYPVVMRHLEEPQCSATAMPIYRLYEASRRAGLTVVLTGEGADELLGGYHWHRGDALARRLLRLPSPVRRWLASLPLPMSGAARRVLARGHTDPAARYLDWLDVSGDAFAPDILSPEVRAALPPGQNPLLAAWSEKLQRLPATSPFHQLLWLEMQTRLADFINIEVDKMSMAHSVEARVPYLDHKLWEFAARLPAHLKLRHGVEKYLLRLAARSILPRATRTRSKKGLAAPYAAWLMSPRLPEWAETALSPDTIRLAGLFNPTAVEQLRLAHQAGHPGLGPLLMGVLSTQVWYQCFIE